MTIYVEGGRRCACPASPPGGPTAWHTVVPARALMVSTLNLHRASAFGPEGVWYVSALISEVCRHCGHVRDCGTGPFLAQAELHGPLSDGGMAELHGALVACVRAGVLP